MVQTTYTTAELASIIFELFGEEKLKHLSQIFQDYEVILCVYGPPASGKDTLLKILKLVTGIPVISMGDELRKRADRFPEINSGGMAKTENFLPLLKQIVAEQTSPAFSLAGSPRKVEEARMILKRIKWVVEIRADLGKCVQNMMARVKSDREKGKERADDKLQTLPKRFALYNEQTEPVISFFKEAGIPYLTVNGNQELLNMTVEFFEKLLKETGVIE